LIHTIISSQISRGRIIGKEARKICLPATDYATKKGGERGEEDGGRVDKDISVCVVL
jgi:hypothetical protein